jgi:hypothetical protein
LIDFFDPHGPSSLETHGLLTSITLPEQEAAKKKAVRIKITFFMFDDFKKELVKEKTKYLLEFFNK